MLFRLTNLNMYFDYIYFDYNLKELSNDGVRSIVYITIIKNTERRKTKSNIQTNI